MFVRFGIPRMFEDLLEDVVVRDFTRVGTSFPALDVAEHDNEYVLVAEMPGVKKEDLKITFEDSVLTLSGERKPYEIPEDARVLLNEVRVREFARSVRMPSDIQVDKISAKLENGVLRIELPKAESARIRNIEIK